MQLGCGLQVPGHPANDQGFLLRSQPGYLPGFFSLPSCRETSTSSEGAVIKWLRPLACDFRRLRFSRNASFSRSCFGFFAGIPVCTSRLSLSSCIVDPFD